MALSNSMADGSIEYSLRPEVGSSRKSSLSSPGSENGKLILPHIQEASITSSYGEANRRRYTIGGGSNPLQSEEKVLPHYLRASTGSCHDFCKYGHRHPPKPKSRNLVQNRAFSSVSKEHVHAKTLILTGRKKMTSMKFEPSVDTKVKSPEPPETVKCKILSPSRNFKVSSKRSSSIDIIKIKSELNVPAKPSFKGTYSSRGLNCGKRNSNIEDGEKTSACKSFVNKALVTPTASLTPGPSVHGVQSSKMRNSKKSSDTGPAKASAVRFVSLRARNSKNPRQFSPSKDQNGISNAKLKQHKEDKVPEKTLHVVDAEVVKKISVPLPSVPSTSSTLTLSRMSSPDQTSRHSSFDEPILSSIKVVRPSSSEVGKFDEPILSSIEVVRPSSSEVGKFDEPEVADSKEDDLISENDEMINTCGLNSLEGHNGGMVLPEDEDESGVKLKFRKGKAIELHSDKDVPRRLRFRKGRVLGENEAAQSGARRRAYRKRESENGTKDSSVGSEQVVLKHQDVQDKKDAQGLFNNVIEETASKLAESRKSKVKALVGAFERVISLQDNKPSPQTVS